MLQTLKPRGLAPRRVWAGTHRGLTFDLDWQHDTQRIMGLYEREIAGHLRRASRGVRTAIDVGAADGWYTLYFLQKTRAERVYSFEPQWAASLLPNLPSLQNPRLTFRTEWVSDSHESVTRWTQSDPAWTTLNALSISYPCVVKVDVDGGELDVLRGATDLMHPSHCRWIIETHSLDLETECIDFLRRFGYAPEIVPNAWWRTVLGEQRPLAHNRWLVAH